MLSFQWISILLISATLYTYLANIVVSCNLAFKDVYSGKLINFVLISLPDLYAAGKLCCC